MMTCLGLVVAVVVAYLAVGALVAFLASTFDPDPAASAPGFGCALMVIWPVPVAHAAIVLLTGLGRRLGEWLRRRQRGGGEA